MRRNLIKQRLLNGETVIGTMIQEMRVPSIAQIMKVVGFDFFMIDMEHGSYSLETAADILRVGRMLDMCPLVRVHSPEYHLITGPLDHGAMGIMLPRIETRAHVEKLVESMKYPPQGKRGCSSDAPHSEYVFPPLTEFLQTNNEDTLVITQIERQVAVERIDDLLSVPGVDVALIGPEDLSVSYGVPAETSHPSVVAAIDRVIESARRHHVVSGIHMGGIEPLKGWMEKGMRMIMYSSDLGFLMEGGAAGLGQLRAAVKVPA
jgi:2-keto-3-deoxy-L-rhamnonate aldolase RhmA